ncbi:DMT family transporter [Dongia rigui]|uniref:DMT family transporter n=1 Tax=Dongia rigui TaxID=940149 RepID=A0ABU5DSR0_9PROT|nr:DMT family transporter [Dongia rigui]MDY0870426.1 DMT family transporter [Dongia rigui]
MSNEMKGVLLAIGATVGWSLSGVFIRFIPEIDAWTFNAYRGASMSIALLLWMLLRYRGETIGHFRQATLVPLIATAGFFGIGSSLYILAMQKASVAAVSCVAATSPLFAALLAWVWLGEKTRLMVFMAILVALGGVGIVAFGEKDASLTGLEGSLIALLVALCFAGQSVTLRRYNKVEMAPSLIVGGFGIFIVVALTQGLAPISLNDFLVLATMGAVQLALPLVLYMRGARYVPAVQMVLISLADAFLNPFWVWLVHGEVPSSSVFLGGVLILGAIAVVTVRKAPSPRAADIPPVFD